MTRSANSAATSSTMTSSPNIGARTYWLWGRGLSAQLIRLGFETRDQLVERLAERSNTFLFQGVSYIGHVDADTGEVGEHPARLVHSLVDGALEPTVILEVVEGLIRHRVHRLRSDEFVHVQGVGVGRVLGGRRRPQRTLYGRTLGGQRLPPIGGEPLLEQRVGQLGVRHGGLAA